MITKVSRAFVAFLVGMAIVLMTPYSLFAQSEKESSGDKLEKIKKLIHQAREKQEMQKWDEAKQLWDQILKEIEKFEKGGMPLDQTAKNKVEAQQNQKIARDMKKPTGIGGIPKINPGPKAEIPDQIGPKKLLRYYPKGRETRNLALLTVKGKGFNKDWGFKVERNFLYIYRFKGTTKVLDNDKKGKLKFELYCSEVSQLVFHAEQTLELDLPDGPLIGWLWDKADLLIKPGVPAYYVAKIVATKVITDLDPGLKKTLTVVHDGLKLLGLKIEDKTEVEMVAKVEKLSGLKLHLDYVDGIGVTSIQVQGGHRIDKDVLLALAENSGLLLDYFVFPGAEKKEKDQWKVRAREVGSLLPLGNDASLFGSIILRRGKDNVQNKQAVLHVEKGVINVSGRGERRDETGVVRVKNGIIHYSLEDLFVESSRLELEAKSFYKSKDHLLFRAERLRDLNVLAVYSAEMVKKGKNKARK